MSKDRELFYAIKDFLAQPEQNIAGAVMPNGVCVSNVYDAYEAGRASVLLAQPEQEQDLREDLRKDLREEPVAWRWKTHKRNYYKYSEENYHELEGEPLYLAPPKREPLSDKHIAEQAVWAANNKHSFKEGVRWAEKQHGIGGGE